MRAFANLAGYLSATGDSAALALAARESIDCLALAYALRVELARAATLAPEAAIALALEDSAG